jgi:uncharacterized Zn finger protein
MEGSMTSESVITKGVRLHDQGKVCEPVDAKAYTVHGDTDTYTVTVYADGRPPICTCPSTALCSHVYAVARERALGGHVYGEEA